MANKKGKIADGDSSSSANSLGVNTFSTSGANTISTNTNTNNSLSSSSSSNNSINGATASTTATTSNNITARRRRSTLKDLQQAALNNSTHPKAPSENANATKLVTRKIDASSPMYQGNERSLIQRIMGGFGAIWWDTLPYWLSVGLMLGLIFGGCCSNVYALEKIVKPFPDTGFLLTFVQFLFIALIGYISQFSPSHPPFFLSPRKVPLRRWAVNIALFVTINIMNNYAFSYNISVPMHIILRSAGSITTIAVGWLWGKRFSRVQVLSVAALTVGVVLAAYSDAASKSGVPHPLSPRSPPSDSSASTYTSAPASSTPGAGTPSALPDFSAGLLVLFIAMVLSAIMGIYTEETYREYGPQWKENLFYSHFLGLPLFIPLIPRMWATWQELAGTPALVLPWHGWGDGVGAGNMGGWAAMLGKIQVPEQIAFLAVNVFTQYACIRGVNLLASASSALTVTIVLNVRKLVSLLLSIWLFGNQLSSGVLLGAVIVFGSGAVYSLDRGGRKAVRRVDRGHLRMESRAGENGKSG